MDVGSPCQETVGSGGDWVNRDCMPIHLSQVDIQVLASAMATVLLGDCSVKSSFIFRLFAWKILIPRC